MYEFTEWPDLQNVLEKTKNKDNDHEEFVVFHVFNEFWNRIDCKYRY